MNENIKSEKFFIGEKEWIEVFIFGIVVGGEESW